MPDDPGTLTETQYFVECSLIFLQGIHKIW
jgi:hypothetical protein